MKIYPTLIALLTFILLTSSHCKKNRPSNPIDQLPPETQTGANTFGCLVNGQVFKPGGAQLSGGSLSCNYQYLNGGFYFTLSAVKQPGGSSTQTSVSLFTDSLKINEGEKLILINRAKGKPYGQYLGTGTNINDWLHETSVNSTGELWIKKLDPVNQIVSGTFWFDAVNANGQKVEIREGRFDVRYTQ